MKSPESRSGHVFHPGHEALHGVTVVVECASGQLVVGRYHERTERGILLHDAARHDPRTNPMPAPDWLAKLIRYGVPVETRQLVIPGSEAIRVAPLHSVSSS